MNAAPSTRAEEPRIVVPGEVLDEAGQKKPGNYTYVRGKQVVAARLGLLKDTGGLLNIIPLSGVYNPIPGDLVVGIVKELGPSNWLIDINSPYPAPMHASETPWDVEFGETASYLRADDTILCKILFVDEARSVQCTMKEPNLKKLTGGQVIEVEPSKVARVIGKQGSMVDVIKRFTDVWLFVGQNGRIWINGEPDMIQVAIQCIRLIEREAHRQGLTAKVEEFLRAATGRTGNERTGESELEAHGNY